jgi:hypothetical protein
LDNTRLKLPARRTASANGVPDGDVGTMEIMTGRADGIAHFSQVNSRGSAAVGATGECTTTSAVSPVTFIRALVKHVACGL